MAPEFDVRRKLSERNLDCTESEGWRARVGGFVGSASCADGSDFNGAGSSASSFSSPAAEVSSSRGFSSSSLASFSSLAALFST